MTLYPSLLFHHATVLKEQGNVFFISDFCPEITKLESSWSFDELGLHIHNKLELGASKRITKILYQMPVCNLPSQMICTVVKIRNDEDV